MLDLAEQIRYWIWTMRLGGLMMDPQQTPGARTRLMLWRVEVGMFILRIYSVRTQFSIGEYTSKNTDFVSVAL